MAVASRKPVPSAPTRSASTGSTATAAPAPVSPASSASPATAAGAAAAAMAPHSSPMSSYDAAALAHPVAPPHIYDPRATSTRSLGGAVVVAAPAATSYGPTMGGHAPILRAVSAPGATDPHLAYAALAAKHSAATRSGVPSVYLASSEMGRLHLAGPLAPTKAKPAATKLERPAVLPAPPFALTPYVVPLSCKPAAARGGVERALAAHSVDYEYNEAKWKAKCYLYHPTGTCHFVVRLYSERAGDDAFLVELQRRKGCARIFRRAFDAVLAALAQEGVVSADSEAAKRVHGLALAPAASAAAPAPALAIAGVDFAGADGGAATAPPAAVTAADAHAIVDAFLPLTAMLAQSFDDIVTPAAQSIASLSTSRRVVAALGMRARAGAEALAAGRRSPDASPLSRQSSTGTASTASPAASAAASEVERRDTQIVYNLLQNLVVRALQPTVSLEARTACAMALANLAQDAACAEVLALFNSAVAVFLALKDVEVSARAAALRRELARVALRVMTASAAAAAAVAADRGASAAVLALATDARYRGHDAAFDRLAAAASEQVAACVARGQ